MSAEPYFQQEQFPLKPHAAALPPNEVSANSVETLNVRIQQLQYFLTQAQEQQRQQQIQHEHQRFLLERSCQDLQSEASIFHSDLVACRREVELLRLRLEEVQVCTGVSAVVVQNVFILIYVQSQAVCDDLRLDKVS
jgi:hypothetical protein